MPSDGTAGMDDEAGDDPAGADVSAASTTSGGFMASTSFEVSVGIRVCSWARVGACCVSDEDVAYAVVADGAGVGGDDGSDVGLDVGACGRVPGRRMERVRPVRVRPSSVTVIAARTSLGGSEGSTSLSLGSSPRLGGT
ncbi:MAG: hypothetical protein EBY47_09025 [Actinobacteria bacterium]|nr:hypothetical protein [Actinomycetota bacterium]